jgi:N-terminal acetyltransferase B complex non-catalytic subunit
MFDSISSFHPHPFTSDDSSQQKTVIDELQDQQRIYKTSQKHISNKRWSSFEHNNYNTIFELEEFKKALAYNVSAVRTVVESRKVSRLIQPNVPLNTSFGGYDILRE